ncbi:MULTISPECIES: hypothetical protein [Myxococcus]|uniref:hypothetical protein n=1 Tax=Myxococcus TaxID=32 RepID=UPI00114156D4|nr:MULTISPECIES: hypothetical protein [Myxococcus]NOK04570.1 hypothetical protein [Myxococcus xanthus]
MGAHFTKYVSIPAGSSQSGSTSEDIDRKLNDFYAAACGYDCAAGLTFFQALECLNTLSKREKLVPCCEIDGDKVEWPKGLDCTGYRLPPEAE